MRKLPALLVMALLFGAAIPAAAADVDGHASIVSRVLDVVERWAAKLRPGGNKAGANLVPDGLAVDDDEGAPVAERLGGVFDPNGVAASDDDRTSVDRLGGVFDPNG